MKNLLTSRTAVAAISLPIVGWVIQFGFNGGVLPMFVQTWGPLSVAIGIVLFRLSTSAPCRFCGGKRHG